MKASLKARNNADAAQMDTAKTFVHKRVHAGSLVMAGAQGELVHMVNSSPRILQQRALSAAINNSPRMVTQRQTLNPGHSEPDKLQENGAMRLEGSAERGKKTNATGMPDELKSGIESLSGMSMDEVKVHYNSDKPAQMQAHAYAQGKEIHLGVGQERHLPHEAWHLVQQAQGRVKPTLHMANGVMVNDDVRLEREADLMGAQAMHDVRQLAKEQTMVRREARSFSQPVVQRSLQIDKQVFDNDMINLLSCPDYDKSALKNFTDDDLAWRFSNLTEAVAVGKMLGGIKRGESYSPDALELDRHLFSILTHFRDPDHPDHEMDSKGKRTPDFLLNRPKLSDVLGHGPSDLRDPEPSDGRRNEALVTAIKLKSMAMPPKVFLRGVQAIDYHFTDPESNTHYGFDPFEMPREGITNDAARKIWINESYEKHVRGKKVNVGEGGQKAHYSGLLDVSGITVGELNTLINAITAYETEKREDKGKDYEPPHLSLVNWHLPEDNVAKYEYPELHSKEDAMDGLGGMFDEEGGDL